MGLPITIFTSLVLYPKLFWFYSTESWVELLKDGEGLTSSNDAGVSFITQCAYTMEVQSCWFNIPFDMMLEWGT